MKIISHRGNIRGPLLDRENRPSYIDCAIGSGYDVEIDIQNIDGELWLGHDQPQYKVDHTWLDKRKKYLWIHCKNLESAKQCWKYQSFCHTQDPFSYTSVGKIWLHDISQKIDDNVIIPLLDFEDVQKVKNNNLLYKSFGICTDYPQFLNKR